MEDAEAIDGSPERMQAAGGLAELADRGEGKPEGVDHVLMVDGRGSRPLRREISRG